MIPKFAAGQKVRLNKRCVITSNVPKNSKGYKYTALALADGDQYEGEAVLAPGTEAWVVSYASHGTGATDLPVVRIKQKLVCCHRSHLDPA